MTAISICSTLATALGPHCKQHVRVIGPGLISCLSDSKVSLCTGTPHCKPNIRILFQYSKNCWIMLAKGALLVGICYNPTPTPCNEIDRMGGGGVLELMPMLEGFVQIVSSE